MQTKRDVYPGTNWIAEIRQTAIEEHEAVSDAQPEPPPTRTHEAPAGSLFAERIRKDLDA